MVCGFHVSFNNKLIFFHFIFEELITSAKLQLLVLHIQFVSFIREELCFCHSNLQFSRKESQMQWLYSIHQVTPDFAQIWVPPPKMLLQIWVPPLQNSPGDSISCCQSSVTEYSKERFTGTLLECGPSKMKTKTRLLHSLGVIYST